MKAMWNGMISFGLVNIPVGLVPATEESDVRFHFLHADDDGAIRNQRICAKCGKVVPFDQIVRGYDYARGQVVTIDDEVLKKAAVESSRNITIEEFVDPAERIPPYYETPYYVLPDKKSYKAYALLRRAMNDAGKVGLAKVALRQREHLSALKAMNRGLMLYMMRLTDEIRAEAAVSVEDIAVGDRELKMAEMLIESMVEKFDPTKYKDTYTEALHAVIEAKAAGKEVETKSEQREATEIIDLMTKLKASIDTRERKPVAAHKKLTVNSPARRKAA